MNSRERVLTAVNHKEPDRIPKDLGATNVTGISVVAYKGLIDLLGIKEDIEIIDKVQGLAKVSPAVKKELGIDTYGLWPRSSKKGRIGSPIRLATMPGPPSKPFTNTF